MASAAPMQDESRLPHIIRITSSGKIKAWVSLALQFFETNEERPLVLHTLRQPLVEVPVETETESTANVSRKSLHPNDAAVTSLIPRLISVAEIIKREYLKTLNPGVSKTISGLHQYNEICCVEGSEVTAVAVMRDEEIMYALQGKNHLKQKQTPYMRITLCRTEIPSLVENGASYQAPSVRKISKSAHSRAVKKQKKRVTATTTA